MTTNDTFIRFKPYFWLKLILFILIFYTRAVIVTKITHQKTRENHIEILTKFVVDVSEYLLVHLDLQLITMSALKSTQKFVNALIGWSRVRSKNSSTSFFFPRAFMTYRSPVYLFQTIMMVRFRGLNPKKNSIGAELNWSPTIQGAPRTELNGFDVKRPCGNNSGLKREERSCSKGTQ